MQVEARHLRLVVRFPAALPKYFGRPQTAFAGKHASSPIIGGRRTKLLTVVLLAMNVFFTDNPQGSPASPMLSAGKSDERVGPSQ
jgi:hypothetical protein